MPRGNQKPGVRRIGAPQPRKGPSLDLVGVAEAAALLGISKAALFERRGLSALGRGRARFPEPVAALACGPIWLRRQIVDYADAYQRAPTQAVGETERERRVRLAALNRILMATQPGEAPGAPR
jgi:hypothetical protein